MARVNHVKRSRKEWKCSGCGADIKKGQPYKHASPGFRGRKIVKCDNCSFRQSELCTSKLSDAYAAQENAEDAIAQWDEEDKDALESLLEDMANDLESVAEEYEDSLSNMPDGLQEGDVGQEMQEKIDALQEWAEELRNPPEPRTFALGPREAICIVCSEKHMIKKKDHGKPATCLDCQCKELNKAMIPQHEGSVLGDCSRCGTVIEVQEGFLVPHHPTRAVTKICAGSAKLCRSYEKFRDWARFQAFKEESR